MDLQLVKMSEKFKPQLLDMMMNGRKPGKPLFHGQSGKSIIMILMLI